MLMPLLVRLIDSQIQAGNGVVAKAADRVQDRWRVGKQISPTWLTIDQHVSFSDLHIEPVDRDAELGSKFVCGEQVRIVVPSVALDGYIDACGSSDALNGDRQDFVGAIR